jgi:heme-degrading monooxygenase HmoA
MIVVIFRSELREGAAGPAYEALAERMWEIASAMPGFVSLDSYTTSDGNEIAIVKFESAETLAAWRNQPEHRAAQRRGREELYRSYQIQVCELVREYAFGPSEAGPG